MNIEKVVENIMVSYMEAHGISEWTWETLQDICDACPFKAECLKGEDLDQNCPCSMAAMDLFFMEKTR